VQERSYQNCLTYPRRSIYSIYTTHNFRILLQEVTTDATSTAIMVLSVL